MTRRKFIALLSSTAVVWPVAALGQPKTARLGVLLFSSSDPQLPTIQDRLVRSWAMSPEKTCSRPNGTVKAAMSAYPSSLLS